MRAKLDGSHLWFWCPGCQTNHAVTVDGSRGWSWNRSCEAPTITPSIAVTYPANPDADEAFAEWRKERRCHSFVTDGRIQFLSDSTHALAGQTVDLPEWQE
jgi:Family of unknown function (DUF6527)